MKRIIINFSNTELVMLDDNDDDIQKYTGELSKLLESNNITILHTSTLSTILRPNNINSIAVYNVDDTDDIQEDEEKIEKVKDESPQDIISD